MIYIVPQLRNLIKYTAAGLTISGDFLCKTTFDLQLWEYVREIQYDFELNTITSSPVDYIIDNQTSPVHVKDFNDSIFEWICSFNYDAPDECSHLQLFDETLFESFGKKKVHGIYKKWQAMADTFRVQKRTIDEIFALDQTIMMRRYLANRDHNDVFADWGHIGQIIKLAKRLADCRCDTHKHNYAQSRKKIYQNMDWFEVLAPDLVI